MATRVLDYKGAAPLHGFIARSIEGPNQCTRDYGGEEHQGFPLLAARCAALSRALLRPDKLRTYAWICQQYRFPLVIVLYIVLCPKGIA